MAVGRRPLIVALLLSVFAIAFQMMGILAALPTVMTALGAAALYAWAMSTFVVGMLTATMVAGRVADKLGPLIPMTVGLGFFVTGLITASLAPNVWVLLIARTVQGLGAGTLNLCLFVIVALAFSQTERSGIMAWFSFMWLLPAFVGPPAAAALAEISWRLVFALTLPLILVAALLALRPLRNLQDALQPTSEDMGRFPVAAAMAVAVAPVGLQLFGEGLGLWSYLAGVAGLTALVLGLRHVLPPAARSLRSGLGPVMVSRAMAAGSFFAAEGFVILGLQDLHGLSKLQAGVALTIGSVGWTAGSWVQSRRWLRLRRDQLISLGVSLTGVGLLGVLIVMTSGGGLLWLGAISWVMAGSGMGLLMPSTAVATMNLSQPWQQGRHSSGLQVGEGLGNAVLTATVGAIYAAMLRTADQETGFFWVFTTLVIALALGLLASFRIGRLTDTPTG